MTAATGMDPAANIHRRLPENLSPSGGISALCAAVSIRLVEGMKSLLFPAGANTVKRYFSRKYPSKQKRYSYRKIFWEIHVIGRSITERVGTVPMRGTATSSIFENFDDAVLRAEQQIQDKLREGYYEFEPPEPSKWYSWADAAIEDQFLKSLESVANDSSDEFYFNPPATKDAIDELEYDCGIVLPLTLRIFLMHYDGGFIWLPNSRRFNNELQEAKEISPELDDVSLKREVIWPRLAGVEEIRKWCKWSESSSWGPGVIPFSSTHNGELLCVWSMRQPHQDSPVFNSFHETPISEWKILYPTFAHLFIDFIQRKTFNSGCAPYYNDKLDATKD
jgi:hypothetical protein